MIIFTSGCLHGESAGVDPSHTALASGTIGIINIMNNQT